MAARYTIVDQGFFDKYTFDVWYNYTAASGDTAGVLVMRPPAAGATDR